MNSDIKQLKRLACTIGVCDLANYLLDDPRFEVCSGSSKPGQHHYGDGGLATHTLEVVELCLANFEFFRQNNKMPLIFDTSVHHLKNNFEQNLSGMTTQLFLSALFHDSGKMYDYEKGHTSTWSSAPHKRLIHHISRSGIIWGEAIEYTFGEVDECKNEFIQYYYEPVLHAILSHHMCREAGSPVAPKTRVAWLLTLCDNISARMNDADTWDVINH